MPAARATHPPQRRTDAGTVKLTDRDITGLILVADQYGAPVDLLAAALGVREERLRGILARWRHAGWAGTGALGKGPAWCWLTPAGMRLLGLPQRAEVLAATAVFTGELAEYLDWSGREGLALSTEGLYDDGVAFLGAWVSTRPRFRFRCWSCTAGRTSSSRSATVSGRPHPRRRGPPARPRRPPDFGPEPRR